MEIYPSQKHLKMPVKLSADLSQNKVVQIEKDSNTWKVYCILIPKWY